MKNTVALSGSYDKGDVENLFQSLSKTGILQMSLVGRHITLQVHSESLDDIKSSLKKLGVSNIAILEWKKSGVTLSNSGKGTDNGKSVNVSLIPSTLNEGIKPLAFLCEYQIEDTTLEKISGKIGEILDDAGISEAIYTVHVRKKLEEDELVEAVTMATLNAIFESGGVVSVE